jgi:hypothetical protein
MMGVGLAGLGRMMMGVMAMTRRGMGVVGGGVGIILFIMLGGFAVMLGGLFMMVGGGFVMGAGGVFMRHGVGSFDARHSGAGAHHTPDWQN